MTILEKIKTDNLVARKNKYKTLASITSTLIGEIEIVGKNNGNRETTDPEAIKVIEKFKKNAESMYELMKKDGEFKEKLDSVKDEIEIYKSYLPEKLSEDELTSLIKDIIDHDSGINIGKVMGFLKTHYDGKYDGAMASKIAKKLIV